MLGQSDSAGQTGARTRRGKEIKDGIGQFRLDITAVGALYYPLPVSVFIPSILLVSNVLLRGGASFLCVVGLTIVDASQQNKNIAMSEVGLMPAPEGETADFHGLSDLQITILAVYITTSALATIGLILRLYTGAILSRNLGLDACKSAL